MIDVAVVVLSISSNLILNVVKGSSELVGNLGLGIRVQLGVERLRFGLDGSIGLDLLNSLDLVFSLRSDFFLDFNFLIFNILLNLLLLGIKFGSGRLN